MAQRAPGFPTAADALPFAEAANLELTRAEQQVCAMAGDMLPPHVDGAETFVMGSFHDVDPPWAAVVVTDYRPDARRR